jgi:6-pyruvoyltetrahydropterin/6-carboxytetrahydropterin synthase
MYLISRDFKFDAAHHLPGYDGDCKNLHGHTWKVRVTLQGFYNDQGMLADFKEIKKILKRRILNKLDHKLLNDVIKNPTCENICEWVFENLTKVQKWGENQTISLKEVTVWESQDCKVTIRV